MAALVQTIAIVDKSNKVVSTSKQLKNVWKEAKLAYQERKAEILAERRAREDRELQKAMKAVSIADETRSNKHHSHSRRHHRHSQREHEPERTRRPSPPAGPHRQSAESVSEYSYGIQGVDSPHSPHYQHHTPLGQFNEELYGPSRSAPPGPNELVRRATDYELGRDRPHHPAPPVRSYSTTDFDPDIDMDLAYGEYHPEPLDPPVKQQLEKQEMSSLIAKCKILLDEANCAQYSVRATVSHLQKNPEAMAAVALTLAEISNIASKMAPGALAAFKSGAPTVFAMLAAPEFLIAVGVGVGITVVMFGGYKIIKKIRASAAAEKEDAGMDEMLDVNEFDRIEHWRRGITDTEADSVIAPSVATSVEGEFITPMAAASMGHLPLPRSPSNTREMDHHRRQGKKTRRRGGHDGDRQTDTGSETSSASRRTGSRPEGSGSRAKREKSVVKVKKPSPLRKMFGSKTKVVSYMS